MYILNGHDLTNTKLNAIYGNMINRCYNQIVQKLKPWYKGCTVDPVWYNPEHWGKNLRQASNPEMHAFYDFVRQNYYTIDGENVSVQLDKDLKIKGNKVYSPDTCLFLPKSVNSFFGGKHKKTDDDLPIGIVRANDGFRLTVKHHSEIYANVEDAFHDWKIYAEGQRDRFLEEYDSKVPQEVLDAIEAYEFEITDR